MINFGFYSAPEMPGVRVPIRMLDHVIEYLSLFLALVIWILMLSHYAQLSGNILAESWLASGMSALLGAFVWYLRYASIRLYRFPVRITERNVNVQYFLASRTCRIMVIITILIFFFRQLGLFADQFWGMDKKIFFILSVASFIGLFLSLIVYYILAMCYRN